MASQPRCRAFNIVNSHVAPRVNACSLAPKLLRTHLLEVGRTEFSCIARKPRKRVLRVKRVNNSVSAEFMLDLCNVSSFQIQVRLRFARIVLKPK